MSIAKAVQERLKPRVKAPVLKHKDGELPDQFAWLAGAKSPLILAEALRWYGTKEFVGKANNPVIIGWAQAVGGWVEAFYKEDSTPWCGLFMAYVAQRIGQRHRGNVLSALEWLKWGVAVDEAGLGDVLVFTRPGGKHFGHVGIYVGETKTHYAVLGANQQDMVCIVFIEKERCVGIRQTKWRVGKPDSVKPVMLAANGFVSTNEA